MGMSEGYTIFDMITNPFLNGLVFDTSEKSINIEKYPDFFNFKQIYSRKYKKLFSGNTISGKHLIVALLDNSYTYWYTKNYIFRKPYISQLWRKIEQIFQEKGWFQKKLCIEYTLEEMYKKKEKTLADYSQDAHKKMMKPLREMRKIEDLSDEYVNRKIPDITFGFLFMLEKYKYLNIERLIYDDWKFSLSLSFSDKFFLEWSSWEIHIFLKDHEVRIHTFKYSVEGLLINGFIWKMEGQNLPDRFFGLICRYFSLHPRKRMVGIEELKLYNTPDSGITNKQLNTENIRKNYIPKINEMYRKHYNNKYLRTIKILDIHSSFIEAKRPNVKGSESMRNLFTS